MGSVYLKIFMFGYHSDLYTMQEPSYLGQQMFSHLGIPAKYQNLIGIRKHGSLIPLLMLTIDTTRALTYVYQTNNDLIMILLPIS